MSGRAEPIEPDWAQFYDDVLARCSWRTSFTEATVMEAIAVLKEQGWTKP